MVVGDSDPRNKQKIKKQEEQFRKNLEKFNIKYKEKKIMLIINMGGTGVPGVFRTYASALVCKKIPIISTYFGEPTQIDNSPVVSNFIEVPKNSLCKAIKILLNLNLGKCEKELCINRFNVDKKCKRRCNKRNI